MDILERKPLKPIACADSATDVDPNTGYAISLASSVLLSASSAALYLAH
jgi:hypothetical protein